MTIQNPNYMYYKQLADTWKSADGSITAILTDTVNITVNYGNATINGYYDVVPAGLDMTTSFPGLMGLGMMGALDGFSYQHNFGEDLKIKLGETALKKDNVTAYNIVSAWHDIEDKLHIDLVAVSTGEKLSFTLSRDKASSAVTLKEGEVQCDCGQIFSGKFCPNCGAMRKEKDTFLCECGYSGPISSFCPNCGKPYSAQPQKITPSPAYSVPKAAYRLSEDGTWQPVLDDGIDSSLQDEEVGWTCSKCGEKFQKGEVCLKCGAEIRKELLFTLSEYKSTNPPQYDGVQVWKFSDTQLITERGKHYRFIPATVIESALEIIKKYGLDKKDENKSLMPAVCGGSQSVSFWDGEKMVGASTESMPGVSGAYYELMTLFTTTSD
ncbi:hypothetical protein [Oribacterium sp. P6A1]|uniref:hypothetical protein n=1 Tax=Oribacterium sp. P6A1 TaxID=1410612 RepID=UPI0005669170|nr:hypothetical protein [Oribacterium sp. P6A1]